MLTIFQNIGEIHDFIAGDALAILQLWHPQHLTE
jgi:hypothetical protein